VPVLRLDAALVHLNRADRRGNASFLGPDPYFDDLMPEAADAGYLSCERLVATDELAAETDVTRLRVNRLFVTGVVEAPGGAHPASCDPDYAGDEDFQRAYAASAKTPDAWDAFRAEWLTFPDEATYRAKGGRARRRSRAMRAEGAHEAEGVEDEVRSGPAVTRAEVCCVAVAECFRGDGEVLANPIGTIPMIGGRLARATFEPDLMMTDGEAALVADHEAFEWPGGKVIEAWKPYRRMFDVVWSGRRHVMMGATQVDRYGNQNIAALGPDPTRPKVQLLGFRGAPGNTINDPTSYWVPNHSPKVFVERVDVVCGSGYDRAAELGPTAARFHRIPRVVSNLGVFDFETPDHVMRLRSVHPGVTVDDVVAATGFELVIPDTVPTSRLPTEAELRLIREVIDPDGRREQEVPEPA